MFATNGLRRILFAAAGTPLGLAACLLAAAPASGSFVVITNRTNIPVAFSILPLASQGVAQTCQLATSDCRPFVIAGTVKLTFAGGAGSRDYGITPNGMYYIHRNEQQQLELGQIGTPGPDNSEPTPAAITKMFDQASAADIEYPAVIPVKILYDDQEVSQPAAWEQRVRRRLEAASQLLRRQCFATFKVVAVERWQPAPDVADVRALLAEFERNVERSPGRLAIGFSGRPFRVPLDGHLGGTRGPLHSHLIVREWAIENTESERLELLVHELGHFLGAAHSPETNSVMRPALGDRQARAAQFRLVFDPLNTLAMCLVSRELQLRPHVRMASIEPEIKRQLQRIYAGIHEALPRDPAATDLIRQLHQPLEETGER